MGLRVIHKWKKTLRFLAHCGNMSTYRCSTCGTVFANKRSLGGHRSRGLCRRSANSKEARVAPADDAVITAPVNNDDANAPANDDTNAPANDDANVITVPVNDADFAHFGVENVVTFTTTQLLQRATIPDATHRVAPVRLPPPPYRCDPMNTYRLYEVLICVAYAYIIYYILYIIYYMQPCVCCRPKMCTMSTVVLFVALTQTSFGGFLNLFIKSGALSLTGC